MIKIEGVTKVYRKGSPPPAVDGLTLDMNDGEVLGLVGLNGAGKTTTIRMSSGITLPPTSGKILVDGFDIVREKVRASRNVGWIPEFPNFEPNAKPLTLSSTSRGGSTALVGGKQRIRPWSSSGWLAWRRPWTKSSGATPRE